MKLKALLLLIALGFIWGSGYSIARFAVTHGVSPLGYTLWQTWGPALFLLYLCYKRKHKINLKPKLIFYFVITGLLGIAIPNSNMYFAAAHLPAGILAIIVNTVPLIIYPLSLSVGEEKFSMTRITGIIIGVIGIMLIVLPKASSPHTTDLFWTLIVLISPVCFASCAVYASKCRVNRSSLVLSMGMLFSAAIILTPITLAAHQGFMLSTHFLAGSIAIIIEIVLSSIGYILFFELLKTAGAVFYSLVSGIVSITGLFWGRIIFGESVGLLTTLAVLLILIALYLVSRKMNAHKSEEALIDQ